MKQIVRISFLLILLFLLLPNFCQSQSKPTYKGIKEQTWQIGYPNASSVTATLRNDTLTVRGAGAMQNWNWETTPWFTNAKERILCVIIDAGVTNVGNFAFGGCSNLSSVIIGNDVTTIGCQAFVHCFKLANITIGNSVQTIKGGAFWSCKPSSLLIPNSVTTIEDNAFTYCDHLISLTVNWTNPLSINSNVFTGVNLQKVKLNVPQGREHVYGTAPVWRNFIIKEGYNRHLQYAISVIKCNALAFIIGTFFLVLLFIIFPKIRPIILIILGLIVLIVAAIIIIPILIAAVVAILKAIAMVIAVIFAIFWLLGGGLGRQWDRDH